jgi:predicted acylesterase/phospholipase RssA
MIRDLIERHPLRVDYAAVLTDVLRLKPKIFPGGEITWQHLAASCAIPGLLPHYKIGGRRYSDGGVLSPSPVWSAVELGAMHIVALQALPDIPSVWLKPFVRVFRRVAGHNPPLPAAIKLLVIEPGGPLGSVRDALHWRPENITRWIEQGYTDARGAIDNISVLECFEG